MFRKADLVLLTKVDLLPHLDFRVDAVLDALARTMPRPEVLQVAARTGAGVPEWIAWLAARRAAQPRPAAGAARPHHHHS
jgi:hydrogenase nickel incorporation protein HypB